MPRPLHKRNFGNASGTSILVNYHNGTSATTGYIVKQLGTNKFRVTSNGSVFFVVTLAQTTGAATSLTAGLCTISMAVHGGGTKYIKKLTSRRALATDGTTYSWQYAVTTAAGQARINRNA